MGYTKHRMLGRNSAHRQALLRNLVTSLFEHESISTTYPKAKEAQRLAEKCITLAKKGTNASRLRAEQILYTPLDMVPRLFGDIAERYKERPGGYTRVLRIEPLKTDQAPSAILELVDGPKDMRFALTAKTVARCATEGKDLSDLTLKNIKKVTQFRKDGESELQKMVDHLKDNKSD
ncbi:50S ribosomal protein L17 [Tricharina praecox]|uniref:50S ribosomal protein L17 n=1 Tax=Tricharina praecox TaxID=43433 RepID=UPI00221F4EAB|nr:50S ribosomal protein L17 [Tricharina praecox]XP_051343673.1 50S ribosomal protein L17 [Tricharina praecox]KAI5841301.1 50S ribosomal protein L17 [Tricharina praecox]KAI5857927.1 50S ribosomal protein L17 [Tricharina praecox]